MASIAKALANDLARMLGLHSGEEVPLLYSHNVDMLCDTRTQVAHLPGGREIVLTAKDNASEVLRFLSDEIKAEKISVGVVECRYCGTQYRRGISNKCESCGGNLPM